MYVHRHSAPAQTHLHGDVFGLCVSCETTLFRIMRIMVLVWFTHFHCGLSRILFFFFQAEDGIRDDLVTGVQTCALPISFWGHDERLIDKDLRSMSGWWRGRWQGRGRGIFGSRGRGRGRGGIPGPREGNGEASAVVNGDGDGQADPAPIPPVEQSWRHDGFEDLDKD